MTAAVAVCLALLLGLGAAVRLADANERLNTALSLLDPQEHP